MTDNDDEYDKLFKKLQDVRYNNLQAKILKVTALTSLAIRDVVVALGSQDNQDVFKERLLRLVQRSEDLWQMAETIEAQIKVDEAEID